MKNNPNIFSINFFNFFYYKYYMIKKNLDKYGYVHIKNFFTKNQINVMREEILRKKKLGSHLELKHMMVYPQKRCFFVNI